MKYYIYKACIILAILPAIIPFTGCSTLTSYEKGVVAGGTARIVFDAPQDEAKFQKVKEDINKFLASGADLTQYVIDQYVVKIQDEFSPAFVALVVERLKLEVSNEFGYVDEDAKAFLQGLADSI